MDTEASTCPQDSNSTDCLLRTLVQILNGSQKADDAKYDWDPITFAFTVIVGAVALLFALVPIIQTIIAPGQGSRTTNRLAIGEKWSKESSRQWNWRQWTYEHTVITPIFRMQTLRKWVQADIDNIKKDIDETNFGSGIDEICEERTRYTDPEKHIACQNSTDDKNTEKDSEGLKSALITIHRYFLPRQTSAHSENWPAATWIDFFHKVGLDRIDPRDDLGRRKVTADYLPSDLVAAPAYAQIGVIVTAASTTPGWAKWPTDPSSNFPVIFGYGFQFDFRQHPILGVLGAYSQYSKRQQDQDDPRNIPGIFGLQWLYDKTRAGKDALQKKEEREKLLSYHSLSRLYVAISHSRASIEADRQSLFSAGPNNPLSFINLSTSYHRVEVLRYMLNLSKEDMHSRAQGAFMLDYGGLAHEQYMPIVGLFLASTPRYVPTLFPTDLLSKRPPLTLLALNGHFWTNVTRESVKGDDMSDWPMSLQISDWDQNVIQWVNDGMDKLGRVKGENLEAVFKETKRSIYHHLQCQGVGATKPAVGLKVALHLCMKLLHNDKTFRTWFSKYHPAVAAYLRRIIHLQLQLLDRWFLNSNHNTSSTQSRAIRICNTTLALTLADEKAPKKDDSTSPVPDELDQTVWHLHSNTLEWIEDLMNSIGLTPETLEGTRSDWKPERSFDVKNRSIKNTGAQEEDSEEILVPLAAQMKPRDKDLKYLACAHYNKKWELLNTHQMLDRLDKVASSRADSSYRKRRFQQRDGGDVANEKTTDDMIIFRCILIALLFQTAPDNAALIKSGVWEQVVAIV
ncbi:uncharacterized protein CCOS01_15490 [Colletotrichum costaricense]|uniref:Uncharacterized protein n=1 Tax=Colletotrichum costaricense TaxID=1209916 RepID=A0AAI9YHJ3_9PEZI|nr:uncharacterized protein CCOS01_15490 [Colletotrichum costaricense]KAK1509396.1 hypothetical protein CCOS01_15490 [Colletotrichum costaricense]